jgi:hypothetical protein
MPTFPRRFWVRLRDGLWYSREPTAADIADRELRALRYEADLAKARIA